MYEKPSIMLEEVLLVCLPELSYEFAVQLKTKFNLTFPLCMMDRFLKGT